MNFPMLKGYVLINQVPRNVHKQKQLPIWCIKDFLSFPLPFQRSTDINRPDYLYRSSDLGEPRLSDSQCCDKSSRFFRNHKHTQQISPIYQLNTCLEDNIKTGTCMIVFELQVANSPRVGTCGTCQYVTIACICTLCNDLYYVNSFTIFFIVLYTSYIHLLGGLDQPISDALYNNG